MRDEDDGAEEMTEIDPLGGAPDPVAFAAAAMNQFEHHPLFPREDGSPETRDIQFVSFCRRRTGDHAIQNCPEDIPAREIKSWAQVVEWWGGGEYKAIAKDGKHRMVAWFPSTGGEWLVFDGESKPFTLRNGKGYRAPTPTTGPSSPSAPPPMPAAAPAAQDALLGVMTEVLQELRAARAAPASAQNNDAVLVAMIEANGKQAAAAAEAHSQMMQTMLNVVTQRPAESGTRPAAEPTTLALQLIGAVQKLVPPPVAQPGLAEQIPVIKALRDLTQPAAPTNELQPFVDIFGQVMAADAARTQAEAARAQTTRPQEPPVTRPPPRPRPPLVHVPGVGMVEVVAPDAGGLRFSDMSVEERAAVIRKDPTLLRALGIDVPPPAVAPAASSAPAPAPPASSPPSVSSAAVASMPVPPAVPDLEPLAVPGAVAPPVAPAAVATAEPTTAGASPGAPTSTSSPPSRDASKPSETPSAGAPQEERPPIALPAQMPAPATSRATDAERERAVSELKRLTSLTLEDRVAALRNLPGIGSMAEDVAHAMASLPADAIAAMAQTLDLDAIGALTGRSNGIAGG